MLIPLYQLVLYSDTSVLVRLVSLVNYVKQVNKTKVKFILINQLIADKLIKKNHRHVRLTHVRMAPHVFKSAQVDICAVVRLVIQATIVLSTLELMQQQRQQQRLL